MLYASCLKNTFSGRRGEKKEKTNSFSEKIYCFCLHLKGAADP